MTDRDTIHEKSQETDHFLTWLRQQAGSETYQNMKQRIEAGLHPTGEMLYKYVLDNLNEQDELIIAKHLAYCERCADEVVQVRQMDADVDNAVLNRKTTEFISQPVTQIEADANALFQGMATDFWEFDFAGQAQAVVAADIPEQEHTFFVETGEIKIHCYWGGKMQNSPAYVWLSWETNIDAANVLYARFGNPDTGTTRCEICLGIHPIGEVTFTRDDLGFDPSQERWTIAIVLREPES